MDSDDSDDEKEPAVKHSQKVPKTQGFVDIDPSTSLLVPAVKNTQKAPKVRDEDPQNTCPGSMHKELAKKKAPCRLLYPHPHIWRKEKQAMEAEDIRRDR